MHVYIRVTVNLSTEECGVEHYLKAAICEDLGEKMVFMGGPRQVGKATLALSLLEGGNEMHPAYLNWTIRFRKKCSSREAVPKFQQEF
jgi:predicted AAA+ superfamily ATPase